MYQQSVFCHSVWFLNNLSQLQFCRFYTIVLEGLHMWTTLTKLYCIHTTTAIKHNKWPYILLDHLPTFMEAVKRASYPNLTLWKESEHHCAHAKGTDYGWIAGLEKSTEACSESAAGRHGHPKWGERGNQLSYHTVHPTADTNSHNCSFQLLPHSAHVLISCHSWQHPADFCPQISPCASWHCREDTPLPSSHSVP